MSVSRKNSPPVKHLSRWKTGIEYFLRNLRLELTTIITENHSRRIQHKLDSKDLRHYIDYRYCIIFPHCCLSWIGVWKPFGKREMDKTYILNKVSQNWCRGEFTFNFIHITVERLLQIGIFHHHKHYIALVLKLNTGIDFTGSVIMSYVSTSLLKLEISKTSWILILANR